MLSEVHYKKKVNPNELSEFVDFIVNNSFQIDRHFLAIDIRNRFLHKKIGEAEMSSFLEDHRSELELLALDHVKKIKTIKKSH